MAFVQLLISGISLGCIYALIALGFVLIYKATETVNFAQGELMMLGAFGGLVLMMWLGWSFWLAAPVAVLGMLAFGIGPAPLEFGEHARHRRRIGRTAVKPEFSCYATHS